MRVLTFFVVPLALFSTSTLPATAAPPRSPLPEEVASSLPFAGLEVVDAIDVDESLPVSSRRAARLAWRHFRDLALPYGPGWARTNRLSVHLVRVLRSSTVSRLGLFRDQIMWLVVVRDVTVPLLGPPGRSRSRSQIATLAVFVRTDVPQYIVASTF